MASTWIQRADSWLNAAEDYEVGTPSSALVAAVIGPQDSGKSSILRRLAIDNGVTPPPWLSVSAREETFSSNSLALLGMEFVDTPGLGALSTDHASITRDTVEWVDAIILVLPPQLIGDAPELHEILAGSMFHPDGWSWPPGAVLYVISKFDEAGVDPDDDLEAYQELAERKRAELNELTLRTGFPSPGIIHVVAPDPYGLVGEAPNVTPADFETGRAWDGMDVLQATLERMTSRADDLRTAANVRQRLAQLSRTKMSMEEARTALESYCAARAIEVETLRQRRDDVDVLDRTARQRLENDLRAAITGMRTAELSHDVVEQRLSETVMSWSDHVEAERARLGSQLQTDVGALQVDAWLPRWTPPTRHNLFDEHRSKVERLATGLRGVLSAWHSSEPADVAATAVGASKQWVEKAQLVLSPEVVGSVFEVVSVLGELQADAAYQDRVDAVRAQIRDDVDGIASRILEGPWARVVADLQSAITDTLEPLQELHEGMLEELEATRSRLDDARELLESAPVTAGSYESDSAGPPSGS